MDDKFLQTIFATVNLLVALYNMFSAYKNHRLAKDNVKNSKELLEAAKLNAENSKQNSERAKMNEVNARINSEFAEENLRMFKKINGNFSIKT